MYVYVGVEKNNDDAKRHFHSCNGHDPSKDMLLAEATMDALKRMQPSVVRQKRAYTKRNAEYWEGGIVDQRRSKRRKQHEGE